MWVCRWMGGRRREGGCVMEGGEVSEYACVCQRRRRRVCTYMYMHCALTSEP